MSAVAPCRTYIGNRRGTRILLARRPADLYVLRAWRRQYDRVGLLFLIGNDRFAAEKEIERDYLECGCAVARKAASLTFASMICLATLFGETLHQPPERYHSASQSCGGWWPPLAGILR